MILPDTSVWVEYLRHGASGRVSELAEAVDRRDVVICGPVVAELVAGTSDRDRDRLARTLGALPWVELTRPMWLRVGTLAAKLRATGQTAPLTDVEIAVAAIAAEATLWSADSDFVRIAAAAPELSLRTF